MSEINNSINKEIEEFNELIKMDMSTFDPVDQLAIMVAFLKLSHEIKPIYAKYVAKDPKITNFLMKL